MKDTVNMNVFLNTPDLYLASPSCTVATFCLLGACADLCWWSSLRCYFR